MSNYFVSVGNREYRVKIRNGKLIVDDEQLDVDLVSLNSYGAQLLRRNRQALELHFSPVDAYSYQVLVEGHLIQTRVRKQGCQSSSRRGQQETGNVRANNGHPHGSLITPMPGLVVTIHVKVGDQVEKGQLLAVVESMKMQMQLRGSVAGKVTCVAVNEGQQVQKNQLLVSVAANPDSMNNRAVEE